MALSASLEASFTAGGFDLGAAIAGLGTLLTDVQLPGLDIDVSVSLDVGGVGTGGVTEALASITGGLDGIVAGLPDVGALLGPLQLAMRVPELIAEFDLDALIAAITAAVVPSGRGLPEFVAATMSIGSVPLVGTLADLTGALGLDLRAPGAMIGGAAGGVVSLVQLFGALLAVESISRTIEERAALASELLGAERLTGLITRVRAAGGIHLAALLEGIDPDDAGIVEVVAPPVEAYLALVGELTGLLVRSLAFAQATVTDADFTALLLGLAAATLGLTDAAVTPVRALVDSAVPLVSPFLAIDVPAGGHDVVFGAVADIRTSIEAAIDDIAPSTISALVTPAIDPVLAPVRAVRAALDEVAAVVGVVFDPIDQALGAVDLQPVRAAIERVTEPVDTVIGALGDAIAGAQSAIDTVVSGVHDALTPVRTTLTDTVGTLTAPFTSVHTTIAALDLAALQADLHAVLDSVTAAIAAAPVQPVFDVATGIINTAADALALVPKALLPDDLRNELEAACAPVESLDLEPARAELHAQLASMIASLDASTLDALAAGFQAVQDFIASIDPHPHVEELEREAFAELLSGLDAIDPTTILAPVTDALDAAREALNGIDLLDVLRPVDEALDDVVSTIQGIDPTTALQPVADALDSATGAVREALHLDGIEAALDGVEQAVADAVTKVPLTDALDAADAAWADLVAALGHPSVDGGVTRALLAGLLPGVPVAGVGEVIAWIRGERDGATVVRARLQHAAALLDASATAVGAIDIRALTAELDAAHRALTAAVSAHPARLAARRASHRRHRHDEPGTRPRARRRQRRRHEGHVRDRVGRRRRRHRPRPLRGARARRPGWAPRSLRWPRPSTRSASSRRSWASTLTRWAGPAGRASRWWRSPRPSAPSRSSARCARSSPS